MKSVLMGILLLTLFGGSGFELPLLWSDQTNPSAQEEDWKAGENLEKMGSDLKEFFEDFLNRETGELRRTAGKGFYGLSGPAVDMRSEAGEIIVECDVPGWDKRDVSVELLNNVLVIRGKKPPVSASSEYLIRERFHDEFERKVTLPVLVNADKVKAEQINGVLIVRLPLKNETVKTVKVKIA